MLRITTRLAHSRSAVTTSVKIPENELKLPSDLKQFILLPALARKRYKSLLSMQDKLEDEGKRSGLNRAEAGGDRSRGIIACGLAYNYYMEVAVEANLDYPVLKISQYPVSPHILNDFVKSVDELVVMEEGAPLLEESLTGVLESSYRILGRLDGTLTKGWRVEPPDCKKGPLTSGGYHP